MQQLCSTEIRINLVSYHWDSLYSVALKVYKVEFI